jgi:hypothetical protein
VNDRGCNTSCVTKKGFDLSDEFHRAKSLRIRQSLNLSRISPHFVECEFPLPYLEIQSIWQPHALFLKDQLWYITIPSKPAQIPSFRSPCCLKFTWWRLKVVFLLYCSLHIIHQKLWRKWLFFSLSYIYLLSFLLHCFPFPFIYSSYCHFFPPSFLPLHLK